MRIVVVGGTGLIGSRLVEVLREAGQDAVPASPSTGVDTLTGAGVAEALTGADVVVDVSNGPSFEPAAIEEFFTTSSRTLLAAEREAGVGHHVVLSIVGTDRLPESGYLHAKHVQEQLVEASGVPYTIVRATQFFEFLGAIADGSTQDGAVLLPT
ncbi:SDR family oxidoreductase, partial [Pseudonocardia pini]|uniref:SDR family oxidoreductase n=1 Tax=Pseudonocardia pini TaxID=2758030 RepID=UPI0015F0F6BC